jgi:hypothetical protein
MKKAILFAAVLITSSLFFLACQEESKITNPQSAGKLMSNPPYQITLEPGYPYVDADGKQVWLWKIVNNPGSQELSHWNIIPGACLLVSDIFYAGFGTDINDLTSAPIEIKVDNSQDCYNQPVFKFDHGVNGNTPSYYMLKLNFNFLPSDDAQMVYKSGNQTDCGILTYRGIGCEGNPDPCYLDETAWGEGARFVPKGNWATYFKLDDGAASVTKTLWAGKHHDAGDVTVSREGTTYTVEYTAEAPWMFAELHFAYGEYVEVGKNPAPGQFPLKIEFEDTYVTTHTFTFEGPATGEILLAAHAVAVKEVICVDEKTGRLILD